MAFKADPPSVRELSSTIGDLATDAEQAQAYAAQWLGIGYAEGRMFATVVEQATAVREALLDNYQRLADIAATSGEELARSADHYRQTDAEELARLDATYRAPDQAGAG